MTLSPHGWERLMNSAPGAHTAGAVAAAIEYFHARLDDELSTDAVDVATAREYFVDVRGWSTETVETKQLGYAPADPSALLDHLMRRGFDRDAILGTGLFWKNGLSPICRRLSSRRDWFSWESWWCCSAFDRVDASRTCSDRWTPTNR